jgi:hypothetical protein
MATSVMFFASHAEGLPRTSVTPTRSRPAASAARSKSASSSIGRDSAVFGVNALSFAEGAFAIHPQDLGATILTTSEPRRSVHLPDSAVRPVAAMGLRRC